MALSATQTMGTDIHSLRRARRFKPGTAKFTALYVMLGLYSAFSIVIFLWVVLMSMKTNTDVLLFPPWHLPSEWQWENFRTAWNNGVATMFKNSLIVTSFGTFFSVGISCLAAYPIARIKFKGSHALLVFFLLGIMIPYMLTAIPLYMKIEDIRQQIDIDSRLILIVLYTVSGFSFNTYVMTGFYKTLPYEMEEAAALDGASPFRTFWQIMLPLVRPGIASLAILNFVSLWNEFFYALIFTQDKAKYTVTLGLVYLDQQAVYSGKWVGLFAAMTLTMIPVLVIFAVLQRQIVRGLTVGAIKG
ncbi:MAG: carbohydrate ABC transporter permease [Thermomicrobiales bacterium]|nr:carbohydrate ABC transporter permease [Thermomicrobiales bacterium]